MIVSSLLDLFTKKAPKSVGQSVSIVNLNAVSVGSAELGRSVSSDNNISP